MSGGFQLTGGWIEVIAGVMFSGKSEELMRRVRRAMIAKKRVQVFKSHLDDRYAGGIFAVGSHDGRTIEAVPVDSSQQIALRIDPMAQVIAIDEALRAIDNGEYGICQRCQQLISIERLFAKPNAKYCVDCLRLLEAGKA